MSQVLTDSAIADVWGKFLTSYKTEDGKFFYFEKLKELEQAGLRTLYLDYDHLSDTLVSTATVDKEEFDLLRKIVCYEPDQARETLRMAAYNLLEQLNEEYAHSDDMHKKFRAEFMHCPIQKEITELSHEDVGKFMKTAGLVTGYDEKSTALLHKICYVCDQGHYTETQSLIKPLKCKVNDCGSTIFMQDDKKSLIEDYMCFDIQQHGDRTLQAKSPTNLEMECIGPDNVNYIKTKMSFGQYVAISGIVRMKATKRQSGQGKSIGDLYIEASHIEELRDSYFAGNDPALDEIIKFTVRHDNPETELADLDKLIRSIVPSLLEDLLLKELVLYFLAGADALQQSDGTRIRGEMQLLYIGDPSIGKSRIAEFVAKVRERVLYNSAGKSSSVGLVGGLDISKEGIHRIKPGVFGLAKDGIVVLDEFAGRTDAEYANLLEPLSDTQSISIAKGMEYRKETVNTAVFAIANPSTKSRYYDSTKNIFFNTAIPSTILSRFDAIIIKKDLANEALDKKKAERYFESQKTAVTEREFQTQRPDLWKSRGQDFYTIDYMRKYFLYIRSTFHPRLSESAEAVAVVVGWYQRTRRMRITISDQNNKTTFVDEEHSIPAADMRKLGSITRLAQARARASMRHFVTKEDAERAIFIVNLTLAEAGIWKQTGDLRQYMKDDLTDFHQKEAQKTAALQKHYFRKVITSLSFEKCGVCVGTGQKTEPGMSTLNCGECKGTGWHGIPFSMHNAITECVGSGKMSVPAFNVIWKEYLQEKRIIQYDDFSFRNTEPFMIREVKPFTTQMDEKNRLRDRIIQKNPAQYDRLMG